MLFEPEELQAPLPRSDRRAVHIIGVLRRHVGDSFDAGVINGPLGKVVITGMTDEALHLAFTAQIPPSPAAPISLLVGLPRPQTARDILRDATTLGVAEIFLVRTEKAERSYAQSSLWHSGEWRRHVLLGAEQAFDTRIPTVRYDLTLTEALGQLPADARVRLSLDNYESAIALGAVEFGAAQSTAAASTELADDGAQRNVGRADRSGSDPRPVVLAIGAERGWSAGERAELHAHGFTAVHLGTRVLRTETAVVAALTLVRAKLGMI